MRNNYDQLLQNKNSQIKIAIGFKIYLDNKMMMITMVAIIKQKYPIVAR